VASLDPALAESIIELLMRVAQEGARTLIVSLHAVELARRYFPRVVALRRGAVALDVSADGLSLQMFGEVFSDGPPEEEKPRHDADPRDKLYCSR
jgi:phosphonate transport system ATP-binding protein